MPELISKVQHKTYEKGEFSEEKPRSLDETITLIKDFPWDAERTLTDVQLTGPSVTIHDEDLNYLKVGLYFGGKFCLYYLDNENHLYEYHAGNIEDACGVVTDFFNRSLDLQPFEKHFFNIGNTAHFITNYFEYREKPWRIIMLTAFLLIYGIGFAFVDAAISKLKENYLIIIVVLLSGLFYYILIKIYFVAFINRKNYLQLSKGNDVFSFGFNEDTVRTYNKKDIDKIIIYRSGGNRNPNLICVYEIYFKDNRMIKFSNMLISDFVFAGKFPENVITYGKKSPLKMMSK
jgi:hypothetical protein